MTNKKDYEKMKEEMLYYKEIPNGISNIEFLRTQHKRKSEEFLLEIIRLNAEIKMEKQ